MELALKSTAVECCELVFSQTVRKEESQDCVVPDTLPDIGYILSTSGNALIRSKDVGEGRIRLEVNIPARVAYCAEEGEGVCSLDVNIPVYLSLEDEMIPEGGICVAGLSLCALEAKELNPRKVCVRAEVEFAVECYLPGRREFSAVPDTPPEFFNLRQRSAEVTPAVTVTEKTFVLSEEFTIPASQPPAAALLGQNTVLQVEDAKSAGTKLVLKGSARSTLLYADPEYNPGSLEFTSSFSQVIETDTELEGAHCAIRLLLSGAYYDLGEGDGRTGSMELHLVAQVLVYGSAEARYIADAYSNRYRPTLSEEDCALERILKTVTLRETLREQLAPEEGVSEILLGEYSLGELRAGEDAALVLPVTVRVFYRTAEGRLRAVLRSFPVRFAFPLEENQRLRPLAAMGQELYAAPAAGGIEIRLPLEIQAQLWETETVRYVTGISYDETQIQDLSDRPTLVLLRAGSEDDLWTLAKENASTVRAIVEANALDTLTAPWKRQLLIPKAV